MQQQNDNAGPDSSDNSGDEPVSRTKRALLKASWVPPVIVAVSLPRSGYAANISGKSNPAHPHHDNGNHFGRDK